MKNILARLLRTKPPSPIFIKVRHLQNQQILECKEGDNLMDVTNQSVNQDVNVYGLCDKQLACTTCSVEIQNFHDRLPQPTEEQLDVLMNGNHYKEGVTRMACQIRIVRELDGMVVRIPKKTVEQ